MIVRAVELLKPRDPIYQKVARKKELTIILQFSVSYYYES